MDRAARKLLAHLATTGTPPTDVSSAGHSLSLFSVGLEKWIDRLADCYFNDLCLDDTHFKLILAPYGGGKTHFLMTLGARALQEGYAISYVQCVPDRQGSPARVDNPLGLYGEVVNHLQLSGVPGQGLSVLLEAVVNKKRVEIAEAGVPNPDAAFALYRRELRNEFPFGVYGDFAAIVSEALRGYWDPTDSSPAAEAAEKWLQGAMDSMGTNELKLLNLKKIPSADRGTVGRKLLVGLAKFITHSGSKGLNLLIDELETLFNAKGKALKSVLAAMRTMIDWPGSFPGSIPMFCVYSAVPDIVEQLGKYPALQQRLAVAGATFEEGNDLSPQISLDQLGLSQEHLLAEIGIRLIGVANASTDTPLNVDLQSSNARRLAQVAARTSLDVNARRLFVKAWAGLLELQMSKGEVDFSEDDLAKRYRGEFESLLAKDKEDFEP